MWWYLVHTHTQTKTHKRTHTYARARTRIDTHFSLTQALAELPLPRARVASFTLPPSVREGE